MKTQNLWPNSLKLNWKELDRLFQGNQETFNELLIQQKLDSTFLETIYQVYLPLAFWLKKKVESTDIFFLGINGGQGAGKSTLCFFLNQIMNRLFDLHTVGFSIDDLYLPKSERKNLAEHISPLLETRGVPGTHEVKRGLNIFEALKKADDESEIWIPTFDKATDDRNRNDLWIQVQGKPRLIIFEGWCVGAHPQDQEDLITPINQLEEQEDLEGVWRNYVNYQLQNDYKRWFEQLDLLLLLKVPDMEKVIEWRTLQEHKLKEKAGEQGEVMNEEQIKRFVMFYERITRHSLETLPDKADIVFHIGNDHQIKKIEA